MKTCLVELRERIVRARAKGRSAEEVARLFEVSKRSVERYWAQNQSTGSVQPKKRGGYRRSRLEGHDGRLQDWIQEDNSITLEEMRERLRQELGISVGTTALWHRLNQLNLSFKKNATRRRAR